MPRKLLFENVPCGRCGGSGSYSYCQMYGSTCFKCAGAGAVLTKRGRAAQLYLDGRKKVSASSVKVGDRIWFESIFGNDKITVVEVNGNEIVGKTDKGEQRSMVGSEQVRRVLTVEQARELRAEALAFQATLTKSGTVAKKHARSA